MTTSPGQASVIATQQQSFDALSTEHLQSDLKGRSVRGGVSTLSSQGARFVLTSVSAVVLARLLSPADFGLVAMVTAVTGMAQAFADLGLSEATIQREKITHNQVSALFWINVSVGMLLMLATAALAPVLALFYREPRLTTITWAISVTFLICGLRVQHEAILKRQMRFSALALRNVTAAVMGAASAIVMAWRGAGYWALVAMPLAENTTQVVLSWLMVKWLPGRPRRDPEISKLVVFGGNVAGSYLITYASRSVDSLLIGWYWGAGLLGLYSRAYNLLTRPVRELSLPAQSVALPAFSRALSNEERFARCYLRVVKLIVWMSAPIFGVLFVASQPIILVVLGARWVEAAPVFQIFAISALAQLLFESMVWLLVSRGESQRFLKLQLTITPLTLGGYVIGLPFGIKGVALAGSLVLVGTFPWMLNFAFRGTPLTLTRLGKAIACPILLALAGVAIAELALQVIAPRSAVSQILVVGLGFAVTYSTSVLIRTVREEIMSFRDLARELILSRRTA